MAQNKGIFCADELKRDLQLGGVFPRFLMPPQQWGKLHHDEKLLLLLLDAGAGRETPGPVTALNPQALSLSTLNMQAKHLAILFLAAAEHCAAELPRALAPFATPRMRASPHHEFLCKLVKNKIQSLWMLSHGHSSASTLDRLPREQVIDLVKDLSQLRACKRRQIMKQQTSLQQATSSQKPDLKGEAAGSACLIYLREDMKNGKAGCL